MKALATSSLAAVAAAACMPGATTLGSPSRAKAVIAASKQASGGAAWDVVDGCYEQGTHADGAIKYKTWFNLRQYGMRVESERGGAKRVMGFNGKSSWMTNRAGGFDVKSDAESLKEAIATAYLSNNAFFFPDRFPADFEYLRQAVERGTAFDVLQVTPRGSRPMEMWFDRKTHLLGRVVDVNAPQVVTVTAADYRRVGELAVAFSLTVSGPDGKVIDRGRVTSLKCGPLNHQLFDPPAAG
jgi:hypothetical protein